MKSGPKHLELGNKDSPMSKSKLGKSWETLAQHQLSMSKARVNIGFKSRRYTSLGKGFCLADEPPKIPSHEPTNKL